MSFDALFERRTLGVRPGLVAVRGVFDALGQPGADVPAVHIVGTNGKGSIAAMTEHALRARGRRTGLFTSPHLQRVTERIRIDGAEVEDTVLEAAIGWVLQLEHDDLPRRLSFFEVLTLAAMVVFEQSGVDVIVAEAGLGGRLDTTRIVTAEAVCMARVDLDHQAYLGDTLTLIAAEKAAVFRDRVPVFSVPQHEQVENVLWAAARGTPCPLRFPDPIPAPLAGDHQHANAAVALAAAQHLERSVTAADLEGTRWPARLERRAVGAGEWVLDVAHNPASMRSLADALLALPVRDTILVTGCSADKDGEGMADALRGTGRCWSVQDEALGLVALPAAQVWQGVDATGLAASLHRHVEQGGRVVVCGSHRLVGAAMASWLALGDAPDPSDPR